MGENKSIRLALLTCFLMSINVAPAESQYVFPGTLQCLVDHAAGALGYHPSDLPAIDAASVAADINGALEGITTDNVWDFLGEFEADLVWVLGAFGLTAADVTPFLDENIAAILGDIYVDPDDLAGTINRAIMVAFPGNNCL